MPTQTIIPLFTAFLNVFQPNSNAAETSMNAAGPAIVESQQTESGEEVETDTAAEAETVTPAALLTCDLDIARTGQQRNVRVIATAGDTPVSGRFVVELNVSGANQQIMRRGVSANFQAGQSGDLLAASMTMSGEPTFAAIVELGPMIIPCKLR